MAQLASVKSFTLSDEMREKITAQFEAVRIDEAQTFEVMRKVQNDMGMILDPHTAIGLGAAWQSQLDHDIPMVTLATAHPAVSCFC